MAYRADLGGSLKYARREANGANGASGATVTLDANRDYFVACDTDAGKLTINLPAITSVGENFYLKFFDEGDHAGGDDQEIILDGAGSDKLGNSGSNGTYTLAANGASVLIYSRSQDEGSGVVNRWMILDLALGSGSAVTGPGSVASAGAVTAFNGTNPGSLIASAKWTIDGTGHLVATNSSATASLVDGVDISARDSALSTTITAQGTNTTTISNAEAAYTTQGRLVEWNSIGGVAGSLSTSGRVTASALFGDVTGDVTGDLTGNADTVTGGVYLTGAQTIGGTKTFSSTIAGSINGTAAIATGVNAVDAAANNATYYPAIVDGLSGTQVINTESTLTYNPSNGLLTTTTFAGALTGAATTAGSLTTARTISASGDITWTSASFDGSGNVTSAAAITAGVIIDADIHGSAAIDATKIANGTVTSTEFQYINTLSSNAQTQITDNATLAAAALPKAGGTLTGAVLLHNTTPAANLSPASKLYVDNAQTAAQSYADGLAQGLDVKDSVVVATTAAFTMDSTASSTTLVLDDGEGGFSASADTLTIDGISVPTTSRILVKEGVNSDGAGIHGKWNGVYTVGALTGATLTLTRAADLNADAEFTDSPFFFVEEGTINGDHGFVVTNSGSFTMGTTAVTVSQFSGAGQITAGAAMTKTANTLNVAVDGSSIEVSGDELRVKASGITNAMLNGSIANSNLANSTISGIALGSNLNSLTKAANSGLALSSYNGSAAVSDLALDLSDLAGATVDVNADSYAFIDSNASSATKKATIATLMAAVAGTGLTEASGQLNVGTLNQNTTGNAGSATLATNSTNVVAVAGSTNASHYLTFVSGTTGNVQIQTDTSLTYNAATDTLTSTGSLTANNLESGDTLIQGGAFQEKNNTLELSANTNVALTLAASVSGTDIHNMGQIRIPPATSNGTPAQTITLPTSPGSNYTGYVWKILVDDGQSHMWSDDRTLRIAVGSGDYLNSQANGTLIIASAGTYVIEYYRDGSDDYFTVSREASANIWAGTGNPGYAQANQTGYGAIITLANQTDTTLQGTYDTNKVASVGYDGVVTASGLKMSTTGHGGELHLHTYAWTPGSGSVTYTCDSSNSGKKDYMIMANVEANAGSIIMLPNPNVGAGRTIVIKDVGGTCGNYHITVDAAAGNIDGAATWDLDANYGSATFVSSGSNWHII